MTKINGPLFAANVRGQIADIGCFRRTTHGAQFINQPNPSGGKTPAQLQRRACFAAAKAAHSALPVQTFKVGKKTYKHRVPDWPTFWRQWLIDHPECTA